MLKNMNEITESTIRMWNYGIKRLKETKDPEIILTTQARLYGFATALWAQDIINYKQLCILEEIIEKTIEDRFQTD